MKFTKNLYFRVFSRQFRRSGALPKFLDKRFLLPENHIHRNNHTNTTVNMPVRVLNVAEKNDAAKSLSEIMSRGRYDRREGFSKFNKLYEFDYTILNQPSKMTMTSVSGHLLALEFVGHFKKWTGCSPTALFDAPVEKYCPDNFKNIKRTLEREVRGCSTLIIWTDGDREGENIGFEIINVCRAVKPNIRVYRARFSEITPQAIQRACRNLLEPDENVSNAVDVRQELDLRIGAAFTRFQTLRLQKVFPNVLAEQLISYGSCQFPTLGFVVERYKQVQNFISEPFWKIKVSHKLDEIIAEFSWARNRLFDHLACLVLYQHCLESPIATVTDIKTKSKSKWRPVALDTVEMEKLGSRKLRINAKETMRIAEKLYTEGYISYPRTETNIFPKELDLNNLIQQQVNDPNWGGFAAALLETGPNPRNGTKTDNAHPPIHPTKYANNLQGNEKRLYEFVVRHFLACCSQDAQGMETTVDIDIADEKFTASGLMIIARNYLEVYPYDKWNAKVIPNFERGQQFSPTSMEMIEGETSPPPLLTEADLIALMDKHGIGTDATHAEHIETIKSRMYVGLQGDNRFVPGELGMGLVEGYDAMGYEMSKPHLRAELEADLKRICDGLKNHRVVLAEQVAKYKEVFVEACRQANLLDAALAEYFGDARPYAGQEFQQQADEYKPVLPCPKCGRQMTIRTKKDGKGYFISCPGYPDCKNAYWFPDFVLAATVLDEQCQTCRRNPHKLKLKFKRGSVPPIIPLEYHGCIGGCDQELSEILNFTRYQIGATGNVGNNRQPSQTGPGRRNNNNSFNDSGYGSSYRSTQNDSSNRGNINTRTNAVQRTLTGTVANNVPTQRNISMNIPSNRQPLRPVQANAVPPFNANAGGNGDSAIVCNCGDDAVLRTVRKDGPNQGRQFYVCNKPKDGGSCQFFLWADISEEQQSNQQSSSNNRFGNNAQNRPGLNGNNRAVFTSYNNDNNRTTGSGDGAVNCRCGEPARSLIVQKDGPNKGRPFYGCPKPRDQGCGFFQWGDEDPGGGNAGFSGGNDNNSSRGTKRKKPAGAGGTRKKPTCGNCGQEGHTRRGCKNN
ncbi:DNA topoisomerase 3-alpha-like [Tubulanus polymorphus]|uniref:DNA topoisomerase 3-alpha-like n=1 Tax=Tubulanus polymorphus TaxID=672921 RepID=UPI003DA5C14D